MDIVVVQGRSVIDGKIMSAFWRRIYGKEAVLTGGGGGEGAGMRPSLWK